MAGLWQAAEQAAALALAEGVALVDVVVAGTALVVVGDRQVERHPLRWDAAFLGDVVGRLAVDSDLVEVEVVLGAEVHHVLACRQRDLRDDLVKPAAVCLGPLLGGLVVVVCEVESDVLQHVCGGLQGRVRVDQRTAADSARGEDVALVEAPVVVQAVLVTSVAHAAEEVE